MYGIFFVFHITARNSVSKALVAIAPGHYIFHCCPQTLRKVKQFQFRVSLATFVRLLDFMVVTEHYTDFFLQNDSNVWKNEYETMPYSAKP